MSWRGARGYVETGGACKLRFKSFIQLSRLSPSCWGRKRCIRKARYRKVHRENGISQLAVLPMVFLPVHYPRKPRLMPNHFSKLHTDLAAASSPKRQASQLDPPSPKKVYRPLPRRPAARREMMLWRVRSLADRRAWRVVRREM